MIFFKSKIGRSIKYSEKWCSIREIWDKKDFTKIKGAENKDGVLGTLLAVSNPIQSLELYSSQVQPWRPPSTATVTQTVSRAEEFK